MQNQPARGAGLVGLGIREFVKRLELAPKLLCETLVGVTSASLKFLKYETR